MKVNANISGIGVSAKFTSKLILARLAHRANENIALTRLYCSEARFNAGLKSYNASVSTLSPLKASPPPQSIHHLTLRYPTHRHPLDDTLVYIGHYSATLSKITSMV